MRIRAGWIAIGLTGACLGEEPGPAEAPGPVIESRTLIVAVQDSVSAAMVEGATVVIGGVSGVTGADGRVSLEVPLGSGSVIVVHPDFDLAQAPVGIALGEAVVLLRRRAPFVEDCQMVEGRLTAVATDLAGRKTLLRSSSSVTLEGQTFGPVTIVSTEWIWSPIDILRFRMFVTPPDTPVVSATWRVYDRDRNMVATTCRPGPEPIPFDR